MHIFPPGCGSVKVFFFSCISLFLVGCIHSSPSKPIEAPTALAGGGLPFLSAKKSPGFYRMEVKRWQVLSKKITQAQEKAEAHLHLAALYLDQGNPGKDYHKAHGALKQAIMSWPDLQNDVIIASWLGLLSHYEADALNFQEKLDGMQNSLDLARQQIGTQRHSIVTLQESIEKLKRAEMVVEKKRRAFR